MRLALILLALLCAVSARAAPIDMNTQTCQDWLDADDDQQDQMVAWLRGYLSGRSSTAMFDLAAGRATALALKGYCQGHLTIGLVSAAGQLKH